VIARLKALVHRRLGGGYGPLARGLGAFGGAELATRVVRLVATVVIARRLAPDIVGEAALALTIFEIVRVLERTGTGQKIVAVPDDELAATCNTANRLSWLWTMGLMGVQWLAAAGLALFAHRPVAAQILAVLALVYPFMAGGHVQYHLALREGRTSQLAAISGAQAIADHILTALLLLIWPDPWSLALPKLLTAPQWLIMTRRARPWLRDAGAGHIPLRGMLRYSASILAAEAMVALRTQGDNLIIAGTMGTTALGTYYFAFNAGLGIVSSLIGAFRQVAFSMLCAARDAAARVVALRRVLIGGVLAFVPVIALQSMAAAFYVPIIFGHKWAFAAPLIGTLCLAGLPLLASAITASWLRAEGRVGSDAASAALACAAALLGLFVGTRFGTLEAAAVGLVSGQALASAIYAVRVLGPALRNHVSSMRQEEILT